MLRISGKIDNIFINWCSISFVLFSSYFSFKVFLLRFLHNENVNYAFICHQLTVTRNQSALASAGQISNSKFFLDSVLLKLHLLAIRMTPQNIILRKSKNR